MFMYFITQMYAIKSPFFANSYYDVVQNCSSMDHFWSRDDNISQLVEFQEVLRTRVTRRLRDEGMTCSGSHPCCM